MNGILTGVEFVFAMVLMLGVVVTVHELGHFWAAKACGVRVLKFSIGFGNPIGFGRFRLRWLQNGTEYVLAWFPLGGFVKMLGEAMDDDANEVRTAHAAARFARGAAALEEARDPAGRPGDESRAAGRGDGRQPVGRHRAAATTASAPSRSARPPPRRASSPAIACSRSTATTIVFWDDFERAVREKPGATLTVVSGARRGALRAQARGERARRRGPARPEERRRLARASSTTGRARRSRSSRRQRRPRQAGLRSGDRVVAVAGAPVEDWTRVRPQPTPPRRRAR